MTSRKRPAGTTAAAKANDGLGVLLALRMRLCEMMDAAAAANVNIIPQIAGRLQAVNREVDERLGVVGAAAKPEAGEVKELPDDELARLRKRAGRTG